jgi:hypothetical protein
MLVNITANGVLSDTSHTLSMAYFTSQCHRVLWYTCKCNFIYGHERNMTIPALIFSKHGNAYVLFGIPPKLDGSNTGSKSIPSLTRVGFQCTNFSKFDENFRYGSHCTDFHKTLNPVLVLHENLLYKISPISVKLYTMYS